MDPYYDRVQMSMSRLIYWFLPQESLVYAYATMEDENIRHIPVVVNDTLVGIVSDRDIYQFASLNDQGELQIPDIPLSNVMTPAPITCKPNSTISEVAATMLRNKIDCIPVIDSNQKLKGIITSSDLIELLCEEDRSYSNKIIPFTFSLKEARA